MARAIARACFSPPDITPTHRGLDECPYQARAKGIAVILITHNVHHALSVADHYIVLIHGEVAANFRKGEKTREEILDLMAGGERLQSLAVELEAGVSNN